jgi:4-hydroxy-L-threonine phosphate dehydrogenase PdxA
MKKELGMINIIRPLVQLKTTHFHPHIIHGKFYNLGSNQSKILRSKLLSKSVEEVKTGPMAASEGSESIQCENVAVSVVVNSSARGILSAPVAVIVVIVGVYSDDEDVDEIGKKLVSFVNETRPC